MTALTRPPIAPVLDRLFEEDEIASPAARGAFTGMTDDDRLRLMASKTGYLSFYDRMKDAPLAVSRDTGRLLYMLARACRARSIVEFGTSFGISTLHLAAALRDNGGGRLITTEFEPSKVLRARANLEAGGVLDLVELREGDALETLASGLPGAVDMLLLDGAKGLYPEILTLVEARLRPGAVVVADNADWSPEYLARVRSPDAGYLSLPYGDEVEVSVRLGTAAEPHFGFRHAAFRVADVERSARFYEAALGMRRLLTQDQGLTVVMTTPGRRDVLTLSQPDAVSELDELGEPRPPAGAVDHVGFEISDHERIGDVLERTLAAGGELVGSIEAAPGYPSAFIRDPDGHMVQLYGFAADLRARFPAA